MKQVCFLLRIKKGMAAEYRKAHQVWPEMQQAIRKAGIKNYSMFLRPDGLLIGYFEAVDPEESLRKLGKTEINQRWQRYMAPYFESGSGDLQKGEPTWLEQIFYLKRRME
ncbi:MAG: L-rhamnose mutarotase [Syntrophomonadaceae bacterium]|nr:L-rhamnose mutarotase [Bacillota bacterium]MBT9147984.1 L-rhamnose mutarotase [Bacillota bacterium]